MLVLHGLQVQAWDDKADSLVQGVRMGDSLFLTGHLAIDRGQDQRTSWRGPALVVQADNWQQIATESIPPGKRHYADRGRFMFVHASSAHARAGILILYEQRPSMSCKYSRMVECVCLTAS